MPVLWMWAFTTCVYSYGWQTTLGTILGMVLDRILEWQFHADMHFSPRTPFFNSHQLHHNDPTPESGVPEWWMFGFYTLVSLTVALWDGPFISGLWYGIVTMLFLYEWVHFLCHCPYRFRTAWGQRVRKNHLRHHFVDDQTHMEMLFPPKDFR